MPDLLTKEASVTTPSAEYSTYAESRRLIEICLGGTEAMRAAGSESPASGTGLCANILPRAPGETSEEYKGRRAQSFAYNLVADAIQDHCDRVFRNPPSLGDDVPVEIRGTGSEEKGEAVTGWAETFDLTNNLDVFMRQLYASAKAEGVAAVLIDMPPVPRLADGRPAEISKADQKRNNRRPYASLVTRCELIEAMPRYVNGRRRLARARIKRPMPKRTGRWSTPELVTTVTVYYDGLDPSEARFPDDHPRLETLAFSPGEVPALSPLRFAYFERYEVTTDPTTKLEVDKLVDWGEMPPLTEVPLSELNLAPENTRGFFDGQPQFVPLGEVQVEHFQFKSRLDMQIRVCNTAILTRTGFTADEIKAMNQIGALRAYDSTKTEAKVAFVEHSGQAIGAGLAVIKEILERGKELSRAAMLPQSGGPVATDTSLRFQRANSQLEAEVYRLVDCIEGCFGYMMWWFSTKPGQGGSLQVDKEAMQLLRVGSFADVLKLRESVPITDETLLREAKRYGVLSEDVDVAKEITAMAQALPVRSGSQLDLGEDDAPPAPEMGKILAMVKRLQSGEKVDQAEIDSLLQAPANTPESAAA